jgi:hypothetical protein
MKSTLAALTLACAALLAACGSSTDTPSCDGVDCGAHGTCTAGACSCAVGFTGARCDQCVLQCTGRQCGDDGCGGTCGTCPNNGACTTGRCPCVPQCSGKTCGDDGCGGSCGDCGPSGVCRASTSQCCTPQCAGKTCGADGCGGTCGRCTGADVCVMGVCGVDNGLACVRRVDTCNTDGDCGGAPNRCVAAPKLVCGMPPDDCGSPTTICRSVLQCWRSCTTDADCPTAMGRDYCVDGLCQACRGDDTCTRGALCVNNNARARCGSAGDCTGVAVNECR